MVLVLLWSVIIGGVFGLLGRLITPGLEVLGPVAFLISLIFFEKVWNESKVK